MIRTIGMTMTTGMTKTTMIGMTEMTMTGMMGTKLMTGMTEMTMIGMMKMIQLSKASLEAITESTVNDMESTASPGNTTASTRASTVNQSTTKAMIAKMESQRMKERQNM